MMCMKCDLSSGCQHPQIEGVGENPADIMLITDNPTYYEDFTGELFKGSLTAWLYRELYAVGLDLTQFYCTSAVKCYSPNKLVKSQIKACREYLLKEIEEVKPKYILVFGNTALEALTGTGNITKHRGKMFVVGDNIKCMATFHPSLVITKPDYADVFRADLNYFARITENSWKEPTDFNWSIVTNNAELDKMRRHVEKCREKSYDIETSTLNDTDKGEIRMIAIAVPDHVYVVPIEPHARDIRAFRGLDSFNVETVLNEILRHEDGKINVAQNAKFDNGWLRTRHIRAHVDFDTFLASYCLNVNLPHDLKYMAKVWCGATDYAIDASHIDDYPFEESAKYCALDAYYTLKLYYILRERLIKDQALARVFKYIMMPVSHVLEDMEWDGAPVDIDRLRLTLKEYKDLAEATRQKIIDICGQDINFNSTPQLRKLLFDKLKLKPLKKTKTGYSTDKSTLKKLSRVHEIPKLILEYRNYDKSVNTFLQPWLERLEYEVDHGREPRLHSRYNLGRETKDNGDEAGTRTGRLSSNDPNLQQVSRDQKIRSLIAAPEGWCIVEADMSQIELRIAAFEADETNMKEIYRKNGDIHTNTAANVAHVKYDEVTKDMRKKAKPVNFGFLYGMWWVTFRDYAFDGYGVEYTDEEAQAARDGYFRAYPKLLPWHDKQKAFVRKHGYVRSKVGRIRHLPNINSPDKDLRNEAERQAINTPVQSFASDITLLNMILAHKQIPRNKAFMVGQVHDAMLFQCRIGYEKELARKLKDIAQRQVPEILEKTFNVKLDIPLVIDVTAGEGWGKGEEIAI